MKLVLLISVVLISVFIICGQNESSGGFPSSQPRRNETTNERNERMIQDSFQKLRKLENDAKADSMESFFSRNIPEPQMTTEQKALITPNKADLAKYADFLKLSKTGIFKIFSAPACGNKLLVDANNEKCFGRPEEHLSYYSFRKHLYGDLDWSDLSYEENHFLVGFERWTIGLIGELGDISLESLSKDSAHVKSLIKLELPQKQTELTKKKEEINQGINLNDLIFSNKIEAKLNQTYLLRTFAYRTKKDALNDHRVGLVVAFKIVGIDDKKGLTIIWKELHKGKTPTF